MAPLSGVTLGVEIIGAEVGVKTAFEESIAAADTWARSTEQAGVIAARSLELTGVAAQKAALGYIRLGDVVTATSAKVDEGTLSMVEAMKMQQAEAVRFQSVVEGAYAKQTAAADAAAAASERNALRYQNALIGAGKTLTTYVTLPLAVAGYAAIKLATDFQASMTRIATFAGASNAEVARQRANILNNAGTLPQGPIQASEALYHLESIGIRGQKAFQALQSASIAAGAGMADLTDSTTALGGALVAQVKGAGDAKTAMAGLIAIAGQGNMTMQDLANALGTGLLVKAHNVGISLREVGAALDVLVDRGIPARRAATYLGTTFALMSAPSKVASDALLNMGINADSMAGMLLKPGGLLRVLEMLKEGMDRVGKAQGARDIMEAFGRSRQSTGILTLIESLNAPVSNYSQKLAGYDKGVQQAAQRMAEYQTTASYKMHTALSMLESDFIRIGQGAAPGVAVAFKDVATAIDGVVKAFEHLPQAAKSGLGILAGLLAVGGPIVLGVGVVLKLFNQLGQIMTRLGSGAAASGAEVDSSLTSMGVAADTTTAQVMELQAALDGLGVAGTVTEARAFGGGFLVRGPNGIIGSVGAPSAVGEGKLLTPTGIMSPSGDEFLRGPSGQFVTSAGNLPPELLGSEVAPAEAAFGASLMTGLRGAGSDLAGVASRALRGGLYAGGGLLLGSMVQGAVGGTAGRDIGNVIKFTGAGAGIGTMIEPGIGTAIGAGIGAAVGGIVDLMHSSAGLTTQLEKLDMSMGSLKDTAHQLALSITQGNLQRMQLQDTAGVQQRAVNRAEIAVANTAPGTAARAAAVRNLREAQLELMQTEQQLKVVDDQLNANEAKQRQVAATRRANIQSEVSKLTDLGASYQNIFSEINRMKGTNEDQTRQFYELEAQVQGSTNAAQAYAAQLINMSNAAQQSDPHLATVLRDIAELTLATNKLPDAHTIKVMLQVSTHLDKTTQDLFVKGPNGLLQLNIPGLPGYIAPGGMDNNRKASTTAPRGDGPLNTQQQIAVALARNPNDRAAIEAQIRYDERNIARLRRERESGAITNAQFVQEVTKFYQDLNTMRSRLHTAGNKGTSAFDKSVRTDNLLAKARLDLENGQYAAAQKLLAEDKQRLEIMLKEAKTSEERNAVLRQLTEVERLQNSKAASFALSMQLQVAMARADALAALDPSLQGPSALQVKLAREAKAQAMKAIASHTLTMQGLIDAWNVVGQANAVLAQRLTNQANLYHKVSTDSITDAVKGLTATQELQLRERLAQSEAHRGHAPNDQGAPGDGSGGGGGHGGHGGHSGGGGGRPPTADAPRRDGGGTVIKIDGTMNFYGVQNIKQLEAELDTIRRQKHGRSGSRR